MHIKDEENVYLKHVYIPVILLTISWYHKPKYKYTVAYVYV